jgi:hypothetical protein
VGVFEDTVLPSGFVCYTEVTTYGSVHPYVLIKAELLLIAGAIVSNLKPITSVVNPVVGYGTATAVLGFFFLTREEYQRY